MSELVVVEESGSTIVVQEVSPASIVEVAATGPQGPQGIQGVKGDTGDVTPEATAAALTATNAATSATASATSASTSASSASTSASNAAASASTATTKASEASTSATNAANSATSAGTSATNAATSASSAGSSASSASASATTATTKASEAATSATNAAASASTAATKASEAATSATNAANSATSAQTSATNASGSATSASTSASAASTSATNAATSATNAAGSATSASTSATSASSSASSALSYSSLAQEWATKTSSEVVTGQGYGAKYYALDASSSASSASSSASTATTQATNASNSASSASTSATSAASSATSASGYATTAQNAATTATTQAGYASTSATNAAASAAAAASSANAATQGGIRFDTAQTLTSGEKAQARTNMGLATIAATGAYSDLTGAPTALSQFTNDSGYITSSALSPYLTSATAASTYLTQANATTTYLPQAGGTLTGNLNFSGTGLRLTGDFSSNATIANRVMFQTSTNNGVTLVSAIPNGNGTTSRWLAYNSSDPANSAAAVLSALNTDIRLASTNNGTGTLLPMTFYMGSTTEAARISTAANFLIGSATDNATDKLQVTGSTYLSGNLSIGGQTFGQKLHVEATGTTDTRVVSIGKTGSGIAMTLGYYATAGNPTAAVVRAQNTLALAFEVMNAEAMRLAPTTSNLLVGTVTDNTVDKVQINGTISSTGFVGRQKPRVVTIADGTSITINTDTTDIAYQVNTQAAGTLTINAPTGTPVDGQKVILRLKSTNVQALSWNGVFVAAVNAELPTASTGSSKYDYFGFIYDTASLKWQMIAKILGI